VQNRSLQFSRLHIDDQLACATPAQGGAAAFARARELVHLSSETHDRFVKFTEQHVRQEGAKFVAEALDLVNVYTSPGTRVYWSETDLRCNIENPGKEKLTDLGVV